MQHCNGYTKIIGQTKSSDFCMISILWWHTFRFRATPSSQSSTTISAFKLDAFLIFLSSLPGIYNRDLLGWNEPSVLAYRRERTFKPQKKRTEFANCLTLFTAAILPLRGAHETFPGETLIRDFPSAELYNYSSVDFPQGISPLFHRCLEFIPTYHIHSCR